MKPITHGKFPLPNFFVIGAAKSGTSALWQALRQHPEIHPSHRKEPHFFLSNGIVPSQTGPGWDYLQRVGRWRPGHYAMLFAGSASCKAIGEASTTYLSSPEAAARIHAKLPHSRIIAVLRQPADRAYSAYNFMRQHRVESETTFRGAMAEQDFRLAQGWAPHFLYEWYGYYHAHLQPWFGLFPRDRIRVFLYDDWRQEPQRMLSELFRFLEVDVNFKPVLEPRNVTRLPRVAWLHRLAEDNRCSQSFNPSLWQAGRQWAHDRIQTANARFNRIPPPPLHPALRVELTRTYRDDILKLEQLLDRDLSHWLAGT